MMNYELILIPEIHVESRVVSRVSKPHWTERYGYVWVSGA